jgi:hypothetical protein
MGVRMTKLVLAGTACRVLRGSKTRKWVYSETI